MSEYTSYYLYQKYEKRGEQDWLPSYPNTFSVNGDGTMPLSAKTENDPECGYSPTPSELYRWVNMDISTNWICDDCQTPPFEGKFKAIYTGGTTYSADCDASSALTSGETRPSGYQYSAMTSAFIGDCVTSIGPWAFGNEFNKFSGLTSVTMADSVTSIGEFAFTDCINLKNITLSNNLVSIADGAFELCDFANISLPDTLISIGQLAFVMCPSLSSITIPDSVTTIGQTCFWECSGLTSCTIGSGITEIGDNAFNNCSGLRSITVNAVTPPSLNPYTQGQETQAFDFTNNAPIYVPSSSVNAYKNATGWSKYSSRITAIPNS